MLSLKSKFIIDCKIHLMFILDVDACSLVQWDKYKY